MNLSHLRCLRVLCLLAPLWVASCNLRTLDLTRTERAEFREFTSHRNLIPATIDRGPLEPAGRPIPADLPLAGWSTRYDRGPDPFPAERLFSVARTGVFRFDFTNFRATENPANLALAQLAIEEAIPDRDVAIRWAEPWVDTGSGLLYTRPADPNLDHADFTVRAVTEAWEPSATAVQRLVASAPLNRHPRGANFQIPLTSPRRFDVTDEVRRFLATPSRGSARNFGFVITPAAIQLLYKTNNRINAGFRVRLILLMRD